MASRGHAHYTEEWKLVLLSTEDGAVLSLVKLCHIWTERGFSWLTKVLANTLEIPQLQLTCSDLGQWHMSRTYFVFYNFHVLGFFFFNKMTSCHYKLISKWICVYSFSCILVCNQIQEILVMWLVGDLICKWAIIIQLYQHLPSEATTGNLCPILVQGSIHTGVLHYCSC